MIIAQRGAGMPDFPRLASPGWKYDGGLCMRANPADPKTVSNYPFAQGYAPDRISTIFTTRLMAGRKSYTSLYPTNDYKTRILYMPSIVGIVIKQLMTVYKPREISPRSTAVLAASFLQLY